MNAPRRGSAAEKCRSRMATEELQKCREKNQKRAEAEGTKMRPVMTTESCLVWVVTRKENVFTKILGKTPTHTTNVNKIVTEQLRGERQ